jgi:hypothetical protein
VAPIRSSASRWATMRSICCGLVAEVFHELLPGDADVFLLARGVGNLGLRTALGVLPDRFGVHRRGPGVIFAFPSIWKARRSISSWPSPNGSFLSSVLETRPASRPISASAEMLEIAAGGSSRSGCASGREVSDEAVDRLAQRLEVGLGELMRLRVFRVEVPEAGLRGLHQTEMTLPVSGRVGLDAEQNPLREAVVLGTDEKVGDCLLDLVLKADWPAGQV